MFPRPYHWQEAQAVIVEKKRRIAKFCDGVGPPAVSYFPTLAVQEGTAVTRKVLAEIHES